MKKYHYAEIPESNEYFEVLGRADYMHEIEQSNGTIWTCSLFECICKACGRRADLRKYVIKKQHTCGCRKNTKSRTVYFHEGKNAQQWADELGIARGTLYARMRKGMTLEEAVNTKTSTKGRKRGYTL